MKKTLQLFLFIALTSIAAKAQRSGDFEMGFHGGLNLANVTTIDGQSNAKPRISFNIAVTGEYYFSETWGLKAKLIYDNKGWSDGFIEDNNFNTYTTDFHLNYITLPVMASWHFGSRKNWYLHAGPYAGFLVSAKDSELGMDLKDAFNSTDFGIALGIGYKFEVNRNTTLFIEYDGQSGLTDIFEENESGTAITNARSALNFGVLFYLN